MRQFTTQAKLFVLILSSLWLSPNKILAQLTLEATYPTTDLRRIQLPVSGEKWYYADDSTRKIYLFNANHTPWKSVNYPSEPNKTVKLDAMNMPVSETTFNSDGLLEFVWRFKDSTGQFVKILNERNEVVYDFGKGYNYLTVNELAGSSTKLFVENRGSNYTTIIFSLPNLIREKIYYNASEMRRQRFSYAGEKYYYKNASQKRLEIFDTSHVRWRQPITIPFPTNASTRSHDPSFFADDKIFNSDTLIEFVFKYDRGMGYIKKVANQNGLQILRDDSNTSFEIDKKVGQPDKVFFNDNINGVNPRYNVFSLPQPITFEHTYSSPVERILLKQFGAKYKIYKGNDEVKLYDTLHRPWKAVKLEPTTNFGISYYSPPLVCDSIVNQDTLLEAIWIERKDTACNLRITSEGGTNLGIIPNASYFQVSQLDNLPNKLVTKMSNGFKDFETKVWRFSTRTPVSDPSVQRVLDAQVSPNPFSNSFTINVLANNRPLSIRLFNAIGGLVFSEEMTTSTETFTPPNGLPQGVYWCQITDGKSQVVKKLVKMN